MVEPPYKRPFEQTDFRGYFAWTDDLSVKLGSSLYHACHEDELRECLDANRLLLRSEWKLNLPEHGLQTCPGVWTGLNYFNGGNNYGPLLMEFPISVLNGKHFMVFRRDEDRLRHFFVQYEARIPVYSFGTKDEEGRKSWRVVKPDTYFDPYKIGLQLKSSAIYDIVLTETISIDTCRITGVSHPSCIAGKCSGSNAQDNMSLAAKIGVEQIRNWMRRNSEYADLVKRFPDAVDETLTIKKPSKPADSSA